MATGLMVGILFLQAYRNSSRHLTYIQTELELFFVGNNWTWVKLCTAGGVFSQQCVGVFVLHMSPRSSLTNMESLGESDRTVGGIRKKGKQWEKCRLNDLCKNHSFIQSLIGKKIQCKTQKKKKVSYFSRRQRHSVWGWGPGENDKEKSLHRLWRWEEEKKTCKQQVPNTNIWFPETNSS